MLEKQEKQRQHLCGTQGVELLIHMDGFSGPQKDGWAALMDLAAASSLVITEEMPTSPYAQWSKVAGLLPFWSTLRWPSADDYHVD